jgi:nanoRNase/pAp phosphatase (c-di-AMP/oligoRNAs hydrolase)
VKIREYGNALDRAAGIYRDIQELLRTQSNNYNLDVTTRLTTATINFKNTIEQTDDT